MFRAASHNDLSCGVADGSGYESRIALRRANLWAVRSSAEVYLYRFDVTVEPLLSGIELLLSEGRIDMVYAAPVQDEGGICI